MDDNFKDIIFFSLHYPYDFSDSYLDEEINLLSKHFRKVIIISTNTTAQYKRETPPNSIVYRFSSNATRASIFKSVKLLLQPFFYREIFLLVFVYRIRLTFRLLKELFAFYFRAIVTKEFIEKVITEQALNKKQLLLYNYWMIESAFASVLLKKNFPTLKVISKAHSQEVYFFRSPVNYHPFRKYIFEKLDHLYFISKNALNYFTETHYLTPADKQKISISRIGIYGSQSITESSDASRLKIISVAYIQKLKRIELIIDALSLVSDIEIDWYHVGHGISSAYFEEIKKYASKKLSAQSNISFVFKGKTPKSELYELYAENQFDLFLNVSETEGIPVSMMEAMSYSVPVIGTNVGGVAEIVENGVNGVLINSNPTAAEIASAIRGYFLQDKKNKNDFRKQAYSTWKEKYNAEKNYREFAENVNLLMK